MSVWTKSGWTKRARRIAFGSALGLAVLAAFIPASARAQDDDDDDKKSMWNLDKKLLNDLMRGLGLRNGGEPQIEYRERSPLVIPPSKNLPPPEQAGAGKSAAWPVDPDVKRKKEAAAKRKDRKGYDPDYEERNLTPSELNPPGVSRSAGRPGTPGSIAERRRLHWVAAAFVARLFRRIVQQLRQQQQGRVCDVRSRAATDQPDRAAVGLPDAVGGSTLRHH